MVTIRSWKAAHFIEIKDLKDMKPMYLIRNCCKQSNRRVRIWQPEPASPHGKKAAIQIEPGAFACFCFDNPDAGSMVQFGMYMYIYICMYMYCIRVCVCVCVCVCVRVCVCVCVCVCVVCVCVCVGVGVDVDVHACTYAYTYIFIYIHVYICI